MMNSKLFPPEVKRGAMTAIKLWLWYKQIGPTEVTVTIPPMDLSEDEIVLMDNGFIPATQKFESDGG
jgi:hypothetical protein